MSKKWKEAVAEPSVSETDLESVRGLVLVWRVMVLDLVLVRVAVMVAERVRVSDCVLVKVPEKVWERERDWERDFEKVPVLLKVEESENVLESVLEKVREDEKVWVIVFDLERERVRPDSERDLEMESVMEYDKLGLSTSIVGL